MHAVERSEAGVYVLPMVVSVEGLPVSDPWAPRMDFSTIGYNNGMVTSSRYSDLYAVVPIDSSAEGGPFDFGNLLPLPLPVQGEANAFYAFVIYAQIDTQSTAPVAAIDVQIAPQTRLAAEDASFVGIVHAKMLSITPQPADKPVVEAAKLLRK